MFSDLTLEERLFVAGIYHKISESMSSGFYNIEIACARLDPKSSPDMVKFMLLFSKRIEDLNLDKQLYINARCPKRVWDNLTRTKRQEILDSLNEMIQECPKLLLLRHFCFNALHCCPGFGGMNESGLYLS